MELRRPLAALLTVLALFGGSATMTACGGAGQDQNDGTTDNDSENTGGSENDLPENSDEDSDSEDGGEEPAG